MQKLNISRICFFVSTSSSRARSIPGTVAPLLLPGRLLLSGLKFLPAGVVLLPRSCAAASSSRVAAAGFGHGQASSCPVRKCKTQSVPCRCSGLCTLRRRRSHSLRKSAKRVQHRGPAPPLRLTPWKPAGDRGLGAVPTSSQLHRLHASVLAQR